MSIVTFPSNILNMKETIYFKQDYQKFQEWLHLDVKSITWSYKNREEFEDFWTCFFIDGLSLKQITERFAYIESITSTGPILSWFNWLQESFITFTFMTKQLTLRDIAVEGHQHIGKIATILRNFFSEEFPERDEYFNKIFQISHLTDVMGDIKFSEISKELELSTEYLPELSPSIMSRIELTLYAEWSKIIRKIKKHLLNPLLDLHYFRAKQSLKEHAIILRDLLLLIFISVSIFLAIKYFNSLYEKYLMAQIKIYNPQFIQKITTHITRYSDNSFNIGDTRKIKNLDDIQDFSKLTSKRLESKNFTTESDITLASWDKLPKNIDTSLEKKSIYEEDRKGGFRDRLFGTNRVYRILMRSVQPEQVTKEIATYLKKYKVIQVDKVKPGTHVPGGYYYNIYVPLEHLKEFLALVMKDKEALLFENKTWRGNTPKGMNKVLIWIKSV